ncbi:MAG TPA: hypothetical protein VF943_13580 [Burkholderiales bacterium]
MSADYGPEFSFQGLPVGLFKDGVVPDREGSYFYEPYRGPGHARMQQELKKVGIAQCEYLTETGRVRFTVSACSNYGVLQLTAFQREAASAP